jgi:CRISPR-associated protein (TIGR03986 family)
LNLIGPAVFNMMFPFRDQVSGSIDVKLKAVSPLFVRNGQSADEKKLNYKGDEQIKPDSFSNHQGKFFIPGSSLKGMVRNALEILSFSNMDLVNDDRYAYRNLQSEVYKNAFKDVRCGWLINKQGEYYLNDCGGPGRISHKELDKYFKSDFDKFYREGGGFRSNNEEQKSAQFKYKKITKSLKQRFTRCGGESAGRMLYEIDEAGEHVGEIVFTGQAGPRKKAKNGKMTGHHLEFVFLNSEKELQVDNTVINNFKFAYFDQDKNRHSTDWKVWRVKLINGERIPVFFRINEEGKVTDLGLSYLYKLPYNKSVKHAIDQKQTNFDLAKCIFGYTGKENSLKGRVQFGHAFTSGEVSIDEEKQLILANPKASYYPAYIRQKVVKGKVQEYRTWDDGTIAGWKRYPVHKGVEETNITEPDKQKKMISRFIPLKEGAEFTFRVNYHNLKRTELGALISALSFHNTQDVFHSLGMAKPFGYGKVKIDIQNIDKYLPYLQEFEAFMNIELGYNTPAWHKEQQIMELITMATEQENRNNSELKYMNMSKGQGNNDFVVAIRPENKEALDYYSRLDGINEGSLDSCLDDDKYKKLKTSIEKDKLFYLSAISTINPREILEEEKKQLLSLLEQERERLLDDINKLYQKKLLEERLVKERLEKEQQEKIKEKKQKEVRKKGLDLSMVNPSATKAWDELRKLIERYVVIYYKDNNYKRLVENHPEGLLNKNDQEILLQKINEIYTSSSTKAKIRWEKDYLQNPNLKKIAEWIGEEKASIINFK